MIEGPLGGFWGSTWMVQTQLGILKRGGGEEEGLFEGLFEGLLPDFSPEVRKSDM